MPHFRPATLADAPAIVALVNAAYGRTGGPVGWTTEDHLVDGPRILEPELRELMSAPAARFELALDAAGGGLLGSVYLRREPDGACYLGMLSVDPMKQAAGLGKALLARSEEIAREWRCGRMRILVFESRAELLAFYLRRGYHFTGKSEPFPAVKLEKLKVQGLRFVELEKPL